MQAGSTRGERGGGVVDGRPMEIDCQACFGRGWITLSLRLAEYEPVLRLDCSVL